MGRKWKKIICLLACWLLVCGMCAAESKYEALNAEAGLSNPDVIGWLEIPGGSIRMPVMRHPTDDAYYAKHDAAGRETSTGALYVQAQYNGGAFTDPVTLIYGSSGEEEAPLRWLQELYSGSFGQCRQLLMHTPDGTKEYTVFAAVPYKSMHILYYYDFHNEKRYERFFDEVFSVRALGMQLSAEERPEAGKDRVLILSTSVRGDASQRYLVMGKETKKAE